MNLGAVQVRHEGAAESFPVPTLTRQSRQEASQGALKDTPIAWSEASIRGSRHKILCWPSGSTAP